ncbi:MAG TPA: hypothetical protein VJ303_07880 [Steroidobacteraceae bacterium]|jgi:hypothetical protein|nr:hypothetical protein [Steroidobacteraceae bacterium]
MPDMRVPGAHLQSLLDEFKFRAETERDEARKHTLFAEAFEQAHRNLDRALREEAAKAPKQSREE